MNSPLFPDRPLAAAEDSAAPLRSRRDSLLLRADLWPADEPAQARSVIVRNLSATGLMAETPKLLPEGRRVMIDVRNIGAVAGTVVWTLEDRMGIAFDDAIDPMRARKPVGRALR